MSPPEVSLRDRYRGALLGLAAGDALHLATTCRVYDASFLGWRPLIARGVRAGEPVIANEMKWSEIRKRIQEMS
ncbi:MAG: hypothetical protein ABI877_19220 [Gemmatimonadaceae bacterium]